MRTLSTGAVLVLETLLAEEVVLAALEEFGGVELAIADTAVLHFGD